MKIINEKYLILGSNSFSGSNFINYLLNKKKIVIGISRSNEYNQTFLKYYKNKNIKNYKFFKLDINKDLQKILKIIDDFKPSHIINFAAQGDVRTSWKYPEQWYKTNFTSLVNFSNKLIGNKYLKKYLSISTPEVYGSTKNKISESNYFDPSTPYALSKLSADLHLNLLKKKYDFPVLFSRSANVYGPHQLLYRIIPRTILYAKLNKKIILHGNGNSKRSFIHINDVVRGYDFILKKGSYGSVYHISPSEPLISIYNLVKKICKIIQYDFSSLVEFSNENYGQDFSYNLNSNKLKSLSNWECKMKLEDGIAQTEKWINDHWENIKKAPYNYKHKK